MLFILGIVCFLLFFVYGLRPLQRWRYRHIPGPCPGWMLGNLSAIVKAGKHEAFRRWAMRYGDVFKILEGGMVTVVVQDPKLARLVNARNHNRHPIPYMETGEEEKFNAAGILFARNAHHRGIRAAWQPMFHAASLQGFCGIFDAAALRLVDRLEAAAKAGDTVDIHSMLGDMTMEISSTTVFGVELGKGSSDAAGLLQASKAFFDAAGEIENIYALLQLMFPPLAPAVRHLATALPTRTYAAGLAGRRAVRAAVTELLRQHKASQAFSGSSSSAGASFTCVRLQCVVPLLC
jgi:cytochrome P450